MPRSLAQGQRASKHQRNGDGGNPRHAQAISSESRSRRPSRLRSVGVEPGSSRTGSDASIRVGAMPRCVPDGFQSSVGQQVGGELDQVAPNDSQSSQQPCRNVPSGTRTRRARNRFGPIQIA